MKSANRFHLCAFALISLAFALAPLSADESFGFGDATVSADGSSTDGAASGSFGSSATGVVLGGELSSSVTAFVDDLDSWSSVESFNAGALAAGTIDFSATGSNADAFAALDFSAKSDGVPTVAFDEAYVRAYFGKLDLETGFRKVSWGKADSSGPLDVVNPLSLSDLTVTDSLDRKIARPMVRASYALGDFTTLEAIYEPSFAGHRIALEGPWVPSQMTTLPASVAAEAQQKITALVMSHTLSQDAAALLGAGIGSSLASLDISTLSSLDTSTLKYSQAGLRLTTTVGSSDIGFQYWYGYLPSPAISIDVDAMLRSAMLGTGESPISAVEISYNRYHQIGADYASVFGKFNVRAELAANITEDLSGDDGSVYNPAIAWSVGFDRDIIASINLNAQAAGSVTLMNDKISDDVSDTEAGNDMTHTTITAKLSRKFLKDEIEFGLAGMYGIEDADFIALPSVVWSKGDVKVELAAGIFGGNNEGTLGQFDDNDYALLSLTYSF